MLDAARRAADATPSSSTFSGAGNLARRYDAATEDESQSRSKEDAEEAKEEEAQRGKKPSEAKSSDVNTGGVNNDAYFTKLASVVRDSGAS